MASVQTGRDLPEAKWKECDVVGLLELILQVATLKDLFLIIAMWNMSIKDVQKAGSAGFCLVTSSLGVQGECCTVARQNQRKHCLEMSRSWPAILGVVLPQTLNRNSCQRTSSISLRVVKLQNTSMR